MIKVFFGIFLILIGLGFFFDQTPFRFIGLNSATIWALFWVMIGVVLIQKKHLFLGILLTIIGVLNFVGIFFHINAGAWIFPVIIIALGIRILIKDDIRKKRHESFGTECKEDSKADYLDESAVFSNIERRVLSQNFKGGKLECIFSGMKIDLTDAKIAKEGATIDVDAVFGGGEIKVSKDMRVVSSGTGVFGGWNNNFVSDTSSDKPVLKIKGEAVFGGVEIKN